MNAKEAHKLSIDSCQNEIKKVNDLIMEACKKGETIMVLEFSGSGVRSYLKDNGYEITSCGGYCGEIFVEW